jgi:alpha,alpha-trehalase
MALKQTPGIKHIKQTKVLAKDAKQFVSRLLFRPDVPLNPEDVAIARDYIREYWSQLERFHPKDDESLLGLPKPYLVPSYAEHTGFDYNELYYASRTYLTGRSQPPFLTTFIFDVYQEFDPGEEWLKLAMDIAKQEYATVWMGQKKPNERLVYEGLSRYYDINYLHDLAEAESGWDMTPRFNRRALNYLPVDLNALLYKYESDFARFARIIGDKRDAAKWEDAAEQRKNAMKTLMWSNTRGMYFDYDYKKKKRSSVVSLATFFPMWAGMVTKSEAESLVKALRRFEQKGGLATTDSLPVGQFVLGAVPTQWAYPNGWAPLHFVVIKALERYGYHKDARRIATKWLKANLHWFNKHGVFLEKYNVVNPDKPPAKGVYPSQEGFGWTNAVFERLCQDYVDRPL